MITTTDSNHDPKEMVQTWECPECFIINKFEHYECINKANKSKICSKNVGVIKKDLFTTLKLMTYKEHHNKLMEWLEVRNMLRELKFNTQ